MKPPFKPTRVQGTYKVLRAVTEAEIMEMALCLAEQKLTAGTPLNSPTDVRNYLRMQLKDYEYEVFCIIYLDTQHVVLGFEQLFRGTIDASSVYPREVVKAALDINAAAVIFVHNHPSGMPEPSEADKRITHRLIEAMRTVDIRVLDHMIVGHREVASMAEKGLI